ncbi:S1 RNA binding domain protein [Ligilactobacillus sp. WC1T17]|uniref:S1 RNA binding domain protein n=1 Tax=Ligilactobacillus ruminis TaxID=1623 RepID=A0ABY1ACD5_9LACO|nr:S1 RNA binding domain protein [Ligilactobacillus ruminis]
MSIEVGAKIKGKVSGITNFGAFVDLGDNKTGLVHISEVSDNFVKDIHDVLSIGDEVEVKVLSVGDDGKVSLSIRKAQDKPAQKREGYHKKFDGSKKFEGRANNNHAHEGHTRGPVNKKFASQPHHQEGKRKDFDSLLAGFLKESDERLTSLKRNTEGKRGGRGGRRS